MCDTSPIQYLHQLELLHFLPKLANKVFVPSAVVEEIRIGHSQGINLPELEKLDWMIVRRPVSGVALPLVTNLGVRARRKC
jgi:predicted nucleic acid-binding protein